jgi:hypothetical protein
MACVDPAVGGQQLAVSNLMLVYTLDCPLTYCRIKAVWQAKLGLFDW